MGITGHRDVADADVERARGAVGGLIHEWAGRCPHTPLRFLSPLAEGADRLAARVFLDERAARCARGDALARSWELVVPMPLPQALYEQDFPGSVADFRALQSQATTVVEVPLAGGRVPSDVARYGPARDAQYEAVGLYVASQSDVLIAIWDGIRNGKTGGTGHIVDCKLTMADDPPGKIGTRESGPVFHVPVRRASVPVGASASPPVRPSSKPYQVIEPPTSVGALARLEAVLEARDRHNARLRA
jgi:hypothetical protein